MVSSKNTVNFKVGENIMSESFKDALEAAYFIEQSPFELITAVMKGEEKTAEEALHFSQTIAPTEYMSAFYHGTPENFQQILGMIAWYQDMQDREELKEAEKAFEDLREFSLDHDF